MTVGESIKTWLYTFSGIGADDVIETEQLDGEAGSIGLYKEPTRTETPFVDGTRDVTERYYFMVRRPYAPDTSRVSNNGWMEELEAWIRAQNLARSLPTLETGKITNGVAVAVGSYMASAETDTAAYQVSIEINYTEV